jgi:hypothetical protein
MVSHPVTIITPDFGPLTSNHAAFNNTNWGGIVDNAAPGGYGAVGGSWVLPSLQQDPSTEVALWVGLGGMNGNWLWQAGTEQEVDASGRGDYIAFFQLWPYEGSEKVTLGADSGGNIVNFPVVVGDEIFAAVQMLDANGNISGSNANQVMFFVENITRSVTTNWEAWYGRPGDPASDIITPGQVQGATAEWITEQAGQNGLADYGQVTLNTAYTVDNAGYHFGANNIDTSAQTDVLQLVNAAGLPRASQVVGADGSSVISTFVMAN